MTLHQTILPQLVERCAAIHSQCGVVLIGSVAQQAERPDSDLDLNLIFPGDECPLGRSPWVAEDNRWQLQLKEEVEGIRIDIAWETQQALLARLNGPDVVNCWPFSNGFILRDPGDVAGPCLKLAQAWFAEYPVVAARFEQQYAEAKRKQQRERA